MGRKCKQGSLSVLKRQQLRGEILRIRKNIAMTNEQKQILIREIETRLNDGVVPNTLSQSSVLKPVVAPPAPASEPDPELEELLKKVGHLDVPEINDETLDRIFDAILVFEQAHPDVPKTTHSGVIVATARNIFYLREDFRFRFQCAMKSGQDYFPAVIWALESLGLLTPKVGEGPE